MIKQPIIIIMRIRENKEENSQLKENIKHENDLKRAKSVTAENTFRTLLDLRAALLSPQKSF
jgi:hypothetical protein